MSEQDNPTAIRDLAITVFETNGRLVETGNELVRHAGLTSAWWQVLAALGYSPVPLPVAHIARNMGLTRQAVQRIVDLLIERDFVRFEVNPHHQRAKLVVLTVAGRLALASAEAAVAPLNRAILGRVGVERVLTAIAVLREMNDVIAESFNATAIGPVTTKTPRKDAI